MKIDYSKVVNVGLTKIRIDGNTQPRKKLYTDLIENYCEQMLDGAIFNPVVVFFDGLDYWLGDGFHRYHASKKAGYTEINAVVVNGTVNDAWDFSRGANSVHGMPRTPDELRDIVISVLVNPRHKGKVLREVAILCSTSHTTVAKIKKSLDLEEKSKLAPPPTGGTSKPKGGKPKGETTEPPATPSAPPPTSEPALEEYDPEAEKISELSKDNEALSEENIKLKDMLAVKTLPASEDAKLEVEETIATLRDKVKTLTRELETIKMQRNDFQIKNADLIAQVRYWKRQADKSKNTFAKLA
jgi:hypothetical protein